MKTHLKKWLAKVILLVAIMITYYFISKSVNFYVPCLFHTLTKLYCPGCGMTRAVDSLLHFDFVQAFCYNPFVYLLAFIIIYSLSMELYYLLTKQEKRVRYPKKVMYVLLGILLIFGVLRNIPGFEFLLPHEIV